MRTGRLWKYRGISSDAPISVSEHIQLTLVR